MCGLEKILEIPTVDPTTAAQSLVWLFSASVVDAATLPERLVVRTWREGDRFHPIGMKGEKKLSDFLVDRKVPLDRKRQVMVVTDGEAIIWVCGMRLDERFRVGKEARKILKLELRPL